MSSPSVLCAGAAGGCGTSVLATGIALAWARAGRPPLLADLDLARGDLAGAFDLPADRTLADLGAVAGEIAAAHLAQVAHDHRSGVRLLLAPPAPARGEVWRGRAGERLAAALCELGPWVADGGPGGGPPTGALAATARSVLVVAPPTLAGARRARRLAGDLIGRAPAPPRLVVGVGPGAGDLGTRATGRAAGLEVAAVLPRDPAAAGDLGCGRWPRSRRSALARELERLAGDLA